MKNKPDLTVIISKLKGKMKGKEDSSGGSSDKFSEMGDEILAAIEDKNGKVLGKLLKDFVSVCSDNYEADDDEE